MIFIEFQTFFDFFFQIKMLLTTIFKLIIIFVSQFIITVKFFFNNYKIDNNIFNDINNEIATLYKKSPNFTYIGIISRFGSQLAKFLKTKISSHFTTQQSRCTLFYNLYQFYNKISAFQRRKNYLNRSYIDVIIRL